MTEPQGTSSSSPTNLSGTGAGGSYSDLTSSSELIAQNILRGLGDRSYDKRKAAALELTAVIRTFQENNEREKIANIINILSQEFVRSRNAHQRKGGLIGLAACAIGFMADIQRYLHLLLPPVLECFDDQESRVCYYACESLYNISKVARNHVLRYFNQIFDGLCKLFAHSDVDVKNGANLLDRLLKDIITETDITFDLETFLPLLQKHIKRTKPYIRQLIIGWITILHNVRHINLLAYLPELLEGIFNMLSDPNREIRQGADTILADFMRDIKKLETFDYGPLVTVVIGQTKSKDKYNRLTALNWLIEFIILGGENLVSFYPAILGSIMYCISDSEVDICKVAQNGNEKFLELVRSTEKDFSFAPIVRTSTLELLAPQVSTRIAALVWIKMLHEKNPAELNQLNDLILPALFKALSDGVEEVVLVDLQVISRICLDSSQFIFVLTCLIQVFEEDRNLLESRGSLIIRRLCGNLDCILIYQTLAQILITKKDVEFVSVFVQILNLILLTAPELATLRSYLQNRNVAVDSSSEVNRPTPNDIFITLFNCWSHSPVATFSLCLYSQRYDLSAQLVACFASIEITVNFLMQIDKLVQLLESPVFIPIRLHLLDVNSPHHRNLLKSLYGLLMMLPQSQAYKTLSDRLSTVSTLKMHLSLYNNSTSSSAATAGGMKKLVTIPSSSYSGNETGENSIQLLLSDLPPSSVEYGPLLQYFEEIQQKHNTFKLQIFQQQNKVMMNVGGSQGQVNRSLSPDVMDQNVKSFSTSDSAER